MTKKERVRAMIEGKPIDYLPSQLDLLPRRKERLCEELRISDDELEKWAENHIFYVYPLCAAEYYSSGSVADWERLHFAVARNLVQYDEKLGVIFDNWGVGWKINPNGVWPYVHPLAGRASLRDFSPPDPTIAGIFDHVEEDLPQKRNDVYIVGLQHILLFERAWTLVGYESFMEKLITDLPFVEELLDMITEYNVQLAYRFVALGVDAVRTGDDYGCQLGLQMHPTLWRRLFKPRLEKIWRVYRENGVVVMHHSCGDVRLIIEDMLDIGLQVLHPVQPHAMPLEELAQKFGNQLVFYGGIDTQRLLPFGTPQEVKEAVRRCIETLGKHGKYIIAPSQEIMNEVPTENILALVEAIREYRRVNEGWVSLEKLPLRRTC